jgi:hypothetical protein
MVFYRSQCASRPYNIGSNCEVIRNTYLCNFDIFVSKTERNFSYLDLLSGLAIGAGMAGGLFVSQLAISSRTLLAFEFTSDPFDALRSSKGLDLIGSSSSNSRPSGRPRVLNPLSNDPGDSITKALLYKEILF